MRRDDGVLECSGISWTICKQSAPQSGQIPTPTAHQSFFTSQMHFPTPNQQCESTEGKNLNNKRVLSLLKREAGWNVISASNLQPILHA